MSGNLSNLMIEMLEEQAALIQRQIERMKSLSGQEGTSSKTATEDIPKHQKKEKKIVDPNRPKRNPSGYQLFMAEVTPKVKETDASLTQPQLMSEIAKRWSALSPEKKKPYLDNAEHLKAEYTEKVKVYDTNHPPNQQTQQKQPVKKSEPKAPASKKSDGPPKVAVKTDTVPKVAVTKPAPVASASLTPAVEAPAEDGDKKKKKRKDEEAQSSPDKKKKKHKKDKSEKSN